MEQLRGARRFRSPLIGALVGPLWVHPKGLVAFAARTEFEKEVDSCGRSPRRGKGGARQSGRVGTGTCADNGPRTGGETGAGETESAGEDASQPALAALKRYPVVTKAHFMINWK